MMLTIVLLSESGLLKLTEKASTGTNIQKAATDELGLALKRLPVPEKEILQVALDQGNL